MADSHKRILDLEEKLTFLEHEAATTQSHLEDIFNRIAAIENLLKRQHSDFEGRIAGLESPPPPDETPPHWGRARTD